MTLSAPAHAGALAYCLAQLPQIPEYLPRDLEALLTMPISAIDTSKILSAPEYAAQSATVITATANTTIKTATPPAHANATPNAAATTTTTALPAQGTAFLGAAASHTDAPLQRSIGAASEAPAITGALIAPAPQKLATEKRCPAYSMSLDSKQQQQQHDALCGGQEHSAQTPFSSSRLAADTPSRNHLLSATDSDFSDPTCAHHHHIFLGSGLSVGGIGGEYTCAMQANGYNFALINSNEMHASSCQHYNESYVLQIPESFLAESINYHQSFPLYLDLHQASEQDLKHLTKAFWRLIVVHECLQDQDGFKVYFNHALYSLLESLLPLVVSGPTLQKLQLEPNRSANLKRLQPVFDFLRDHYHEPLRLEELAALAHLHPGYFCSVFKDAVGMSPMSYLSEIRMCHVYYDLAESKLPISTILQRHGYTNIKKFYRLFKERFHVSPREVRASHDKQAMHANKGSSYFDRLFTREETAPAPTAHTKSKQD